MAGRPPKFKSVQDMERKIKKYFKDCEGRVLKDKGGEILRDKHGEPMIISARPPTITGLALALGFNSRQSLLNYQAKKEFMDTITRAKSRVECYTEERLFDKEGANGAKFSLRNNFKGWKENPENDESAEGAGVVIINAIQEEA